MSIARSATIAIALVLAAHEGRAQSVLPAATEPPSAICTDRPTRSNFACTVDAGHFQYESDLANLSELRQDGVTTDTALFLNATLKWGVTSDLDVEANIAALEVVRTRGPQPGSGRTSSGPGDLYLRLKYSAVGGSESPLQVSLLPYLKVPTAGAGIGNGVVESGLIVPINLKLGPVFTLTFDPEMDALKNATGDGRHLAVAQLVNLGASLPHRVTLYGELWGDWSFDPHGVVHQASADAAVAIGATRLLQFDLGVNLGLNRYTPGAQVYVGLSQKF